MRRRLTVNPGPGSVYHVPPGSATTFRYPFVVEGDFDFEVEDLDEYVQVKTNGYSKLTYRDPSGSLEVGDHVIVPLGWRNTETLGTVVDHGRNGYEGYTKDVTSRLEAVRLG